MKRVITGCVLVALLALACGEEEGITAPPVAPPDTSSPADVLENVEKSFNQRNVDLLKAALSDDFTFYFDARDVGRCPPGSSYEIPTSWPYTEFWKTAWDLFCKAYSVNFDISAGGIGTPAPGETTYRAEDLPVSLLVMVDERNGYVADGGYCDFEFEVYYNQQKQKRWRLTGWWDRTGESFTSLGRILAIYR